MKLGSNTTALLVRLRPACWSRERLRANLIYVPLLVGGLIILGFSFSALLYFIYASTGSPITWKQAWSVGLTQWWGWSLLYLLIFAITRRLPIERQHWMRGVFIYFALGLAITLLKLGIDFGWLKWIYRGEVFKHTPERSLLAVMTYFNFLTYWAFVSVGQALNFYRQAREGELKAAQLETQLAQAQLQALKTQLQPHFLFNTLHTIAMLNLKDPKAANRMLSRLSDLLRLALDNAGAQEVSLQQEMDFLGHYLEIQQTRFADRLEVSLDIDPAALAARVPNLILQPIVENAIRHGVAEQEADGRVEIHAVRQNGWLQLRVHDNGPGLPAATPVKFGIGLKNTQDRLAQLYGASHRFELKNAAAGGLEVTITVPFRASTPTAEDPEPSTAD